MKDAGCFVTEEAVARVVDERSSIPVSRLESEKRQQLRDMDEVSCALRPGLLNHLNEVVVFRTVVR